mmetsp:Transcript_11541/g.20491  ORF Transcript_11541/g.20491 Transcript_11541/m.20491 type:complete len:430 (+) Transcript_11541:14-1303(+)
MFTILSMATGAAAVKVMNKLQGKHDSKHDATTEAVCPTRSEERLAQLQRREANLKKALRAMEAAAGLAKEELKAEAETLRASVELLAKQKAELAAQKEELAAQKQGLNQQEAKQAEELNQQRAHNVLLRDERDAQEVQQSLMKARLQELDKCCSVQAAENCALNGQVKSLRKEHEAHVREFEEQLEGLRSKVSGIISMLLSHELNDQQAVAAVRALGCTIEFVEQPAEEPRVEVEAPAVEPAVWNGQTTLLLDNRERLERLMAGGMMRHLTNGGEGGANKVPVITFPSLGKGLLGVEPRGTKQAPALTLGKASSAKAAPFAAQLVSGSADVGVWSDQASTGTAPSAAVGMVSPKPVNASNGVQFAYKLQGSQGRKWVEKVPLGGDASVPAAYLPAAGRDQLGHDMMGTNGHHNMDTPSLSRDTGLVVRH